VPAEAGAWRISQSAHKPTSLVLNDGDAPVATDRARSLQPFRWPQVKAGRRFYQVRGPLERLCHSWLWFWLTENKWLVEQSRIFWRFSYRCCRPTHWEWRTMNLHCTVGTASTEAQEAKLGSSHCTFFSSHYLLLSHCLRQVLDG
jgi:hypothetical protein